MLCVSVGSCSYCDCSGVAQIFMDGDKSIGSGRFVCCSQRRRAGTQLSPGSVESGERVNSVGPWELAGSLTIIPLSDGRAVI